MLERCAPWLPPRFPTAARLCAMDSRGSWRRRKSNSAASIRSCVRRRSPRLNSVCSRLTTLGYTQRRMAAYRKILVLLDLSEDSEKVAIAGRDMASPANAEMVVLHVVDFVPAEPMGESMMPTVQIENDLIRRAGTKLSDLAARLALPRATTRVEAGNTKAEILRVAEEVSADLIVLGSRERHGLAIMVNFTEDTVLHAAHCDVLAVRLK